MTYDGNNFLNKRVGFTLRETDYLWRATKTQFLFENTEYFIFLTVYYKYNLLYRLCRRPNIFHTKI